MFSCCIFKKNIFIYLREKERACTHMCKSGGRGKGRKCPSQLPLSREPNAGLNPRSHEIRTRDASKS